jgi:hypothetical protein
MFRHVERSKGITVGFRCLNTVIQNVPSEAHAVILVLRPIVGLRIISDQNTCVITLIRVFHII